VRGIDLRGLLFFDEEDGSREHEEAGW